jgi:hypothetical protein
MKIVFLHGNLVEWIYIAQPQGFLDFEKENYVCLLKKSLYGLKQSPRQWYKRFDAFMISYKFVRNPFNNCFYSKRLSDGSFIYLLLYVNDILITTKNMAEIESLKTLLSNEFEMKD